MIAICAVTLIPNGVCQQRAAKSTTQRGDGRPVVSRVPAEMLVQLSGELQQLASKVSSAVVHVEVAAPEQEGVGPEG